MDEVDIDGGEQSLTVAAQEEAPADVMAEVLPEEGVEPAGPSASTDEGGVEVVGDESATLDLGEFDD